MYIEWTEKTVLDELKKMMRMLNKNTVPENDYIKKIGPTLDPDIYEQKGENIWIAKSAKVAPSASITGPCIIGERTEESG